MGGDNLVIYIVYVTISIFSLLIQVQSSPEEKPIDDLDEIIHGDRSDETNNTKSVKIEVTPPVTIYNSASTEASTKTTFSDFKTPTVALDGNVSSNVQFLSSTISTFTSNVSETITNTSESSSMKSEASENKHSIVTTAVPQENNYDGVTDSVTNRTLPGEINHNVNNYENNNTRSNEEAQTTISSVTEEESISNNGSSTTLLNDKTIKKVVDEKKEYFLFISKTDSNRTKVVPSKPLFHSKLPESKEDYI